MATLARVVPEEKSDFGCVSEAVPSPKVSADWTAFIFDNRQGLNACIALFYDDLEIRKFHWRAVGQLTLFVPNEAVALVKVRLSQRRVNFEPQPVLEGNGAGLVTGTDGERAWDAV